MADIAAFVREQLDEDQAIAETATPGRWELLADLEDCDTIEIRSDQSPAHRLRTKFRWVVSASNGGGVYEQADAEHIARHDPARVLRQIAATRTIVELHDDIHECVFPDRFMGEGTFIDYGDNCPTLRLIAATYADRPGYQPTWRPDA